MSSRWIADAESAIFTLVYKRVKDKFKTKYPELYFTRDSVNDELSHNMYPTCYIKFSEVETGHDIENVSTNAVLCTVQISVTASVEQSIDGAKDIIYEVLDQLKSLHFNIVMMPEYVSTETYIKQMTARARRVIGANDNVLL